ncbi:hypothetical protein FB45DRAFT_1068901 [Roridomyces roridus]|uniref:F-box domain-containing protein n=1 Tax=Roridomyces roridus TaxID=1738132 RepID=A0AAD7F6Y9_9AGAR|nr:hypothetical protein FB45DRAFT_1068901 [Roridomyces roridus]
MDQISSMLVTPSLGHSLGFDQQVKQLIQTAEESIARIDSQIRDLLRLRDRERGVIAALKFVAAPIRKLPAELLVDIFLRAASDANDEGRLRKVLAISHVCAHWNRLACTTPQLWNQCLLPNLTKAPSESYLATTKSFLERSAPLPIPVRIEYQFEAALPLSQLLFGFAPRWKSLSFSHSQITNLRQLPMDALQRLESIDLWDTEEIPPHSPIVVFLGAPRLHTVILDCRNHTRILMPWSQLTKLVIRCFLKPAQDCLGILIQCESIVSADISGILLLQDRDPGGSVQTSTLARLKELCLGFDPVGAVEQPLTPFFASLALPALTKLTIRLDSGTEAIWSPEELTSFQRRSPNMEHLELVGLSITSYGLVTLVTNSPSLIHLELHLCFDNEDAVDSTLQRLRYTSTHLVHAAPRLRNLYIIERFGDFDETALEDMIFSRWWTDEQLASMPVPPRVARLETVHICSYSDLEYSKEFLEKMKQLREEGLVILVE